VNRAIIPTITLLINFISFTLSVYGQEMAGHIDWNPVLSNNHRAKHFRGAKTTATTLTLPFFEDFTGYSPLPDSNKWVDDEVYINNTMCASPISRGVATFDALDARGIPYDSFSNSNFRYADSLTSQPIDLSNDTAGDSIYLSFFYQPQGNGFYPLTDDSLMLFLKNRFGDFILVWSVAGTGLQPFQQVMIPITDTLDFHNSFQFRFVNKAALDWADAVWNVDYIRLDKNRNMYDTAVNDIAFTYNPTFLLNDYTSMPYNQFIAAPGSEIASQVTDSIRNNSFVSQSLKYSSIIYDLGTGAILTAAGPTSLIIPGTQTQQAFEPLSIGTYPTHPANVPVVFETEYFFQTPGPVGSLTNDTIVKTQAFDNYLAYDDGTAEKSYYLNLFPSLPGKIAIEYHLNHPDTLRGLAIYFGRQVPFANSKVFAIYIYSAIAGINGATHDIILDSTDLLEPGYADSVNHFWNYAFTNPLILPAGTFYAGTLQPLGGGSDSLYFGLDVNRIGPNHAYYNVLNRWVPSAISGAIMIRPLLGHQVFSTGVPEVNLKKDKWAVLPNPAKNILRFEFDGDGSVIYNLSDLQGRAIMQGCVNNGSTIDIGHLAPGTYFVNITRNGVTETPQKVIKL
jgi:hypothetical protein